MRRGRSFICSLCLYAGLGLVPLAAQDAAAALPAVSRLRLSTDKTQVTMTWIDSEAEVAAYAVYRSTEPFSVDTFARAQKIGSVASGLGKYVDEPPGGMDWYYAVLALDPFGKPYLVFKKLTTMTGIAVSVEGTAKSVAQAPAASASQAPSASQPQPAAQGAPSTKPPSAQASPAAQPAPSAPKSTPAPQKEPSSSAQAAVQAAAQAPNAAIAPMPAAAPTVALTLPAQPASAPTSLPPPLDTEAPKSKENLAQPTGSPPGREAPLPFYLYVPQDGGTSVPAGRPLVDDQPSAELLKAMSVLIEGGGTSASLPTKPDFSFAGSGDDGLLPESGPRDTLDSMALDMVNGGDFSRARDGFSAYLSQIPPETTQADKAKAQYYLGVALAELGLLQDALYSLILAEPAWPREAKPWLDYVIDALGHESQQK